ncbi:MAG: TrmB family transcriptional regulator [Candidatus Thermoplasmatota archaeon]|nr:TrmB family transcriptional regulator [Candidatus Thermoplasmatota archaeon]MBS3802337.1 TrmB family transcriptional regulator [Candidatus Thermoplasmatota archaeon]
MGKERMHSTKALESLVQDILKSRAQSRIYLYLIRKNGAKTEDIIKGTRLHPSTVRETLVKMHEKKLIFRKKQKNDNIGKNPYTYFPLPVVKLLKRYASDLEKKLNDLASLSIKTAASKNASIVKINIIDRE